MIDVICTKCISAHRLTDNWIVLIHFVLAWFLLSVASIHIITFHAIAAISGWVFIRLSVFHRGYVRDKSPPENLSAHLLRVV